MKQQRYFVCRTGTRKNDMLKSFLWLQHAATDNVAVQMHQLILCHRVDCGHEKGTRINGWELESTRFTTNIWPASSQQHMLLQQVWQRRITRNVTRRSHIKDVADLPFDDLALPIEGGQRPINAVVTRRQRNGCELESWRGKLRVADESNGGRDLDAWNGLNLGILLQTDAAIVAFQCISRNAGSLW